MGDKSNISWTDATWNPVVGCSHVSPGCEHCYAEALSLRRGWTPKSWTASHAAENVQLKPERLDYPLRWKAPRRIFVNSMSDLFHELVPDEFIDQVFAVMAIGERHVYQVLTKRPARMQRYLSDPYRLAKIVDAGTKLILERGPFGSNLKQGAGRWPLANVWLGVSAEDQRRWDERTPLLAATPAAVRYVSAEPLLGPIDAGSLAWVGLPRSVGSDPSWLDPLDRIFAGPGVHSAHLNRHGAVSAKTEKGFLGIKPAEMDWCRKLDWLIVGGESAGPEERMLVGRWPAVDGDASHRPAAWSPIPERALWVRSLRDQCAAAGTAFFFKQWGGARPTSGGDLLDGVQYHQFPEAAHL